MDDRVINLRLAITFPVQSFVISDVSLGLGPKAKYCGLGLGLAIGWPWPWDFGLGLRGLALAKNSRPKSWRLQNSPLTSIDWSTVTGVNYISRSKFLTYLQWAIVAL